MHGWPHLDFASFLQHCTYYVNHAFLLYTKAVCLPQHSLRNKCIEQLLLRENGTHLPDRRSLRRPHGHSRVEVAGVHVPAVPSVTWAQALPREITCGSSNGQVTVILHYDICFDKKGQQNTLKKRSYEYWLNIYTNLSTQ